MLQGNCKCVVISGAVHCAGSAMKWLPGTFGDGKRDLREARFCSEREQREVLAPLQVFDFVANVYAHSDLLCNPVMIVTSPESKNNRYW